MKDSYFSRKSEDDESRYRVFELRFHEDDGFRYCNDFANECDGDCPYGKESSGCGKVGSFIDSFHLGMWRTDGTLP